MVVVLTKDVRPSKRGRTSLGDRRSAILGVYEQARRSIIPILHAEGGAVDARADDDLVPLGPHPLDSAQGDDLAGSLAPALFRRPVAAQGADLTVDLRLEPLDKVAVVIEARPNKCVRKVCVLRRSVVAICIVPSPVGPWLPTAGRPYGTSIRRPLTAQLGLFAVRGARRGTSGELPS